MNWLILVAVAVIFDSIRIFIDNYVSDVYFKEKDAVSQKLFYGYSLIIISVFIIMFTGFDFTAIDYRVLLMLLLSGILSGIAGIPYIKALEIDNSTNLGIFIQLAPVMYLVLGWLFLGETISIMQLIAIFVILLAPLLIVTTARKKSRKIRIRAVLYAFLYVLIAVIGNLVFVKASSSDLSFINELAILFFGKGIANLVIIYTHPKWRRRFLTVAKKSQRKVFSPMVANLAVGLIKDYTYRLALVLAPAVALASAVSDSAEPIFIFFMGIVFTLIWPKFGREKLDKKTILVHLGATILVVIGVVLIQM
ncbi:EamA family transporter [Candidatus Saccharibacteria bacterium]|nr:EamA family transporter [Candidatus Saccharibacteria bacterium]